MDQDIEIINQNTRIEKFKNFFKKKLKIIILVFTSLILSLFIFFILVEMKKNKNAKIAENYNKIVTQYQSNQNESIQNKLIDIINENNETYSPLALYFIIDNQIIKDKKLINDLFNEVIENTKTNTEIKNLIIYKKALFNSENLSENELLILLKPILNSESIWKSHSLYLISEFFYSKNEKTKSQEFLNKIISLENSNSNIKTQAQKKLNRDF